MTPPASPWGLAIFAAPASSAAVGLKELTSTFSVTLFIKESKYDDV